jgi:hypothetical protein
MTKAVRDESAIRVHLRAIGWHVEQLLLLVADMPLTIRIETNNVQECLDLLDWKLREERKQATKARLAARRKGAAEEQPYLPLIDPPPDESSEAAHE